MIYGPLLTLNGDFIVSEKPLENINARRNSFMNLILKSFVELIFLVQIQQISYAFKTYLLNSNGKSFK